MTIEQKRMIMTMKNNSVLLQINTRVWLKELKEHYFPNSEKFYLSDIPIDVWQQFKDQGFDVIYLLGVWEVDTLTKDMFAKKGLQAEFDHVLPSWKWEDTCGSPFAIKQYALNPMLGNENTLQIVKQTLNNLGLELILDFVPNHFGLQTPQINIPNLFIEEKSFTDSTNDYEVYKTDQGKKAIYHGKDPYFPPWEDTLQLDYSSSTTKEFMKKQLISIAEVCNGVRCDMAMLIVNRIIQQVWGAKLSSQLTTEFWDEAIKEVKQTRPNFAFIAEVYWDMEDELINLGFDYCYDKKLYDSIRDRNYGAFEFILHKVQDSHNKTVRFLENHDEPRAITVFNHEINYLASVITFTLPGIKFFHQKQFVGYSFKESLFLVKRSQEPVNSLIKQNYSFLLSIINKFIKNGSNWQNNPDILAKNIDVTRNIYIWQWDNPKNNSKLIIIINYKDIGAVLELDNSIQEYTIFDDPTNINGTKINKQKKSDLMFEIKPFGCVFISL